MINKNIIIYPFVLVIILSSFVLATGVTYPSPPDIELTPGQSERFRFSIQSGLEESVCSYQITDPTIIDVQFDEKEIVIEGNRRHNVFGTVTVPEDAQNGEYITKFCAGCNPTNVEGTGSPLVFRTCELPIKVNVVGARTRENMKVELEAPEKPIKIPTTPVTIFIIIILILIALILWYKHEKKQQEWTKPRKL